MSTAVRLCLLVGTVTALCATPAHAERLKGRVLDVDQRHSEVRVDVAGQRRRYHVEDRSLYRVLHRDRVVIIRAELVGGRHTIVDAESAALVGRVEHVDAHRDKVVIKDAESRTSRTYYLDPGVPHDLRKGESVAFDVEERGSHTVITGWHRQ
jgi:hypothetical protein